MAYFTSKRQYCILGVQYGEQDGHHGAACKIWSGEAGSRGISDASDKGQPHSACFVPCNGHEPDDTVPYGRKTGDVGSG